MDAKDRTRLRALRKRADGSWRLLTADDVDSDKDIAENGCTFVADLGATDVRHRRCWSIVGPLNIVAMPHEIGALIVGAVNALPALLDDADAADARIAKAERKRDEARDRVAALETVLREIAGSLRSHERMDPRWCLHCGATWGTQHIADCPVGRALRVLDGGAT